MTQGTKSLQHYSWDQAAILGFATARGFGAVGLNAATVRKWASRGAFKAVGKAPGGAHFYEVKIVIEHAERNTP